MIRYFQDKLLILARVGVQSTFGRETIGQIFSNNSCLPLKAQRAPALILRPFYIIISLEMLDKLGCIAKQLSLGKTYSCLCNQRETERRGLVSGAGRCVWNKLLLHYRGLDCNRWWFLKTTIVNAASKHFPSLVVLWDNSQCLLFFFFFGFLKNTHQQCQWFYSILHLKYFHL